MALSPADEQELLRLRGWIDGKLTTLEAEPNAEIIRAPSPALVREPRIVADRPRQTTEHPFGAEAQLVLHAIGDSMTDGGILPDVTLYATPSDPTAGNHAIGMIIACRYRDGLFVKRLVSELGRRFLLSAHPRYRPLPRRSQRHGVRNPRHHHRQSRPDHLTCSARVYRRTYRYNTAAHPLGNVRASECVKDDYRPT